jgi:MFS transporter, DHA1 family, inner membrane transport protein
MPLAVYALTAGAFGIGTTEFVIMGLLMQVAGDFGVSVSTAGLLISGYALGVVAGAPILTLATRRLPRKTVLLALMLIFTIGNLACALAPNYEALMAARIVTALAHGTFFGVGSVVATSLVAPDRKASAISVMFTGLTVATLLGVPFGAWLGLAFGWRATFFVVTAIGVVALIVLGLFVPRATAAEAPIPLRQEIAAILKPQVQLGFLMTVLGFAGVFTVFTYIQPILVQVTDFSEAAVSPILLVFGLGLIGGNLLGGRLADRNLVTALIGTLAALLLVLVGIHFALDSKVAAIVGIGLLGVAAFATVAPLQLRVLEKAGPAGQNFASSLNIAAFNLGNAIGAWLGGVTLDHGFGLGGIPMSAAAITALGVLTALWSLRLDRAEKPAAVAVPAE